MFNQAGTTADTYVATDADEDAGAPANTTTDGCSAFSNAAVIAGDWAYVDRGGCTFAAKIDNAEAAGATGIVIGQNSADPPFPVSGRSDLYGVMVSQADGTKFKTAGAGDTAINVTVSDVDTSTKDDSHRWLVSEKSPAFGGAIRDMWNPNCYGDPGKVSDAEYQCSTDDSGGVHGNSGVPNHTFALVVDGGTFNGVPVAGIGLDKAANIWWETGANYLTPTSNFVDFANGLDSACLSLIGQEILEVSTDPESPGDPATPITAADCTAVSAAALATELRKDPAQCNFQPILAKDAPSVCGEGFTTSAVFSENFTDGLKGWTKSEDAVFNGAHGIDWRTTVYPPDRKSSVAYAPDPAGAGDCSGGSTDVSSRNSITSPVVTMPKAIRTPRLTFNHYVATELGFDGGNVRVKVNNGSFKLVPEDAFIFNAYNDSMESAAAGNTSPLAGQPGFTGTDGNEPNGSWGQSQINLVKLGVGKNDKVRIRFDFGRDGCGGQDGWYVDDVRVVICKKANNRTLATKP